MKIEMTPEEKQRLCQYATIYRRDYIKRKLTKTPLFIREQEFKNPIGIGFKTYLQIDKKDLEAPEEDGDVYVGKVKEERKSIGRKHFKEPLDHRIIKWNQILDGKSIYQVDYCDIEGDMQKKMEKMQKIAQRLPDGWQFPLTTQKYDFRDPASLTEYSLERPSMIKPLDNIVPDEKLNEIMKIRKIDSEYNSVIGKLGGFIVKNEIHGDIEKIE